MVAERCCGTRIQGDIYVEVDSVYNGVPIDQLLCDPPILIDSDDWEVCAQGMTLMPREQEIDGETRTIYHLLDIVGKDYYPNVADVIEEGRVHGFSRKIQSTIDFSKLDPVHSRLLLAHPKAFVSHCEDYAAWECPFGMSIHHSDKYDPTNESHCCVGVYWRDIESGEVLDEKTGLVERKLPSISYTGYKKTRAVRERYEKWYDRYRRAIFISLPISRIAIVKSAGARYEKRRQKLSGSKVEVVEVDE